MIQMHYPDGVAVKLEGLTKRFGKTKVVDGISLEIPYGSVFGLIGPNGAGKSTTLKMLMNMLRISDGQATVFGADVQSEFGKAKPMIGYVPEHHHIYRWMTIARVIRLVSSLYPTWNKATCERTLKLFKLDPGKKVKQLSKGMLAKLALLLAISHEPKLLILDEPLSGLDPIVRDEFLDGVMQSICEGETSVIFSSHTIDDVQRLANNVGLLNDGKLLVNRPVEHLLGTTKRVRAIMSGDAQPDWFPESTINQRLNRREWTLTIENCSDATLGQLQERNDLNAMEVMDLNLEELFKEYIYGSRGSDERVVS